MAGGSLAAPFLIGLALGDLLHGLPVDKSQEFTGGFADLFQPYGVYTGVTLVALCVLHGSTFLALKTTGDVQDRAATVGYRAGPVAGLLVLGFVVWTRVSAHKGVLPNVVEVAGVLAVFGAAWLARERRAGWAFAATTFAMAATVLSIFTELYPRVMVSSTSPGYSLTISNTASPSYTLKLMTIVVVIFLPVVLLYQAWTYYVFRQRISPGDFQPPKLLTKQPSPNSGKPAQ